MSGFGGAHGAVDVLRSTGELGKASPIRGGGRTEKRTRRREPGKCRGLVERLLEDLRNSVSVYCQWAFIAAPSMTTPAVTYFHSAISSLRAITTMVVFL